MSDTPKLKRMLDEARSAIYLADPTSGAVFLRWEKAKGPERYRVATYFDGSRIYFDRNGDPLNLPM